MNLQEAEGHIRRGAKAGFLAAGLNIVIVGYALVSGASGGLGSLADPWNLVDGGLLAALSFGVWRRSRLAAIVLFVYFLAGRLLLITTEGSPIVLTLGVSFVFLYCFAKGIQGTFVYHRIRRREDPDYRAVARWNYFVWPPVGLVLLLIVAYGVSSELHLIPSTSILSGTEVRGRELRILRSEGILDPGEEVVLFFSYGVFSIKEGGSVLTDRRVVSYERVDGTIVKKSVGYGDIVDFFLVQEGDLIENSLIIVHTRDGGTIRLVGPGDPLDRLKLIGSLRYRWHAAQDELQSTPLPLGPRNEQGNRP